MVLTFRSMVISIRGIAFFFALLPAPVSSWLSPPAMLLIEVPECYDPSFYAVPQRSEKKIVASANIPNASFGFFFISFHGFEKNYC